MSIEAVGWALRVPVGGNAKVVLLGLANHAHPDGSEAYPALDTLSVYAHCDRSTARRNVRKLEADGWILPDGAGPAGQNKYRLRLDIPVPRDGMNLDGVVVGPWRTCVYCGAPADVLDHVVPKASGGSDGPSNRAPACTACNASKGALTLAGWAAKTGRDPAELEALVRGWQNATVAAATGGGGSGDAGGVALVPPEPSIEPLKGTGDAAREDVTSSIPEDFPDELRPHARLVLPVLRAVAVQHNAREVKPLALGRVMMARPRKPFVKAAHDFASWAADPPRPIKDVVASYRRWLDNERDLQAVERLLPGENGRAVADAPVYSRNDV